MRGIEIICLFIGAITPVTPKMAISYSGAPLLSSMPPLGFSDTEILLTFVTVFFYNNANYSCSRNGFSSNFNSLFKTLIIIFFCPNT